MALIACGQTGSPGSSGESMEPLPGAIEPSVNSDQETTSLTPANPGEHLALETSAEALTAESVTWSPEGLEVSLSFIELDHPALDLGRVGDTVWVATETQVLRIGLDSVQPVEYWAEDGGPEDMGTIEGFLKHDDGLFVVSSNGLFEPYEWALVKAPLGDLVPTMTSVGINGATEELAYFAGSDEGTHYLDSTGVYSLTLDGEGATPLGITSTHEGGLLVTEGSLYDMNLQDALAGVLSTEDMGSFAGFASREGASAVAYDQGILWRDSSGTFIRLLLEGIQPDHVSMDSKGRILVASDDRVVRVHETGAEVVTGLEGGMVALATDAFDHVWVASGSTLTRLEMGEGVSFETDIAPLFESECNGCHVAGYPGPKHDFTQYEEVMALDDAILERVSLGLMPPGGLVDEQLEKVLLWYQSGGQP